MLNSFHRDSMKEIEKMFEILMKRLKSCFKNWRLLLNFMRMIESISDKAIIITIVNEIYQLQHPSLSFFTLSFPIICVNVTSWGSIDTFFTTSLLSNSKAWLILQLSFEEVSQKLIPYFSASCYPCFLVTFRSDSKSDFVPTNNIIVYALPASLIC